MILPSKHISQEQTLLGVGAIILREINRAQTVTSLWERIKNDQAVGTFERFVLALDMLYIAGVITFNRGIIERTAK